jgi:cytochrome c-type biogenesis protein CcmE
VGIGAIGLLAATGLGTSLVYYKTTGELLADPALHGHRVRVGGLVLIGSVHRLPAGVAFTLSDGVTTLPVVNTGTPAGIFAAGQGAIVEGTWDRDGVFRSDTLIVKHSNEYRSKNGRPYIPPTSTGPR